MISFLIKIDRLGIIKEIKWSNPGYIIPELNKSIVDLFVDSDKENLLSVIGKNTEEELSNIASGFNLKNHSSMLKLWSISIENDVLILGVDEEISPNNKKSNYYDEIIFNFMRVNLDSLNSDAILYSDTARVQFEKIQLLNNELINTKRMLEKSNAKYNLLNEDLNNRLVKDALTGLVSRYQYGTEMQHFISKYPGKLGVFTFIDIDHFKSINDNYGHLAGDKYLIEFSNRLKNIKLKNTVKMRISGDEFGLFTYGLEKAEPNDIYEIWLELKNNVLSRPILIDGNQLNISISAGMAIYGIDTTNIYELIDYADFAMYEAKSNGKNDYCIFNKSKYNRFKGDKHGR